MNDVYIDEYVNLVYLGTRVGQQNRKRVDSTSRYKQNIILIDTLQLFTFLHCKLKHNFRQNLRVANDIQLLNKRRIPKSYFYLNY
mgnify:CR=1 FL=1